MFARLTLESGSAIPADCTLRPDQPVSLGRGLDNAIVLSDHCASKWHARIFADAGRWRLRDLDSRNGVLVNGRRVRGEVELTSGAEIGFGEIRFRFTAACLSGLSSPIGEEPPVDDGLADVVIREGTNGQAIPSPKEGADEAAGADDQTALHPDELTALYQFLSGSLAEAGPHGLIRLALEILHRQTRADFVGYRGLDADDLLMVLPERELVDARLSNRMTQKALGDGAPSGWRTRPTRS